MNMQPMNTCFYDASLWKRTGKKKYEIWATVAPPGIRVKNQLEGCEYVTNENTPVILSGTVSEQWVTSLEKLATTYTFAQGDRIGQISIVRHMKRSQDGWMKVATIPGQLNMYALHLNINKYKNVPIQTSWGDILIANKVGVEHAGGDFLVCSMDGFGAPNFADMWVVNGKVFLSTYNIQAFNLSPRERQFATTTIAPRPAKLNIQRTSIEANCFYFLQQHAQKIADEEVWKVLSFQGDNAHNANIFYIRANCEDHVIIEDRAMYLYNYIVFRDLTYGVIERPNASVPFGSIEYVPKKLNITCKDDIIKQLRVWGYSL